MNTRRLFTGDEALEALPQTSNDCWLASLHQPDLWIQCVGLGLGGIFCILFR